MVGWVGLKFNEKKIIVLEAPALENINQVVYKMIEKDPKVISTETSIVLSPM